MPSDRYRTYARHQAPAGEEPIQLSIPVRHPSIDGRLVHCMSLHVEGIIAAQRGVFKGSIGLEVPQYCALAKQAMPISAHPGARELFKAPRILFCVG
jgi:hypothetical protein